MTWTQADAIALRGFLAANPKVIHILKRRGPEIKGSTMEERAMTGSEAKGFTDAILALEGMCLDPQGAEPSPGFIE